MAASLSLLRVYRQTPARIANPIRRSRTVLSLQCFQRPVRIRDHVNTALRRTHQDRIIRWHISRRRACLRSVENLPRVFQELAHTALSLCRRRIRAICESLVFFQFPSGKVLVFLLAHVYT